MSVRLRALRLVLLAFLLVVVGACARQDPTTLEPDGGFPTRGIDSRPLLADVTAVVIEPTPGGGILRVTGVADSASWWDIALRRDRAAEDSTTARRYALRGFPPVDASGARVPVASGPVALREVEAAVFLSNRDLAGLRSITVVGANSSRTLRR